MNEKKKNPSTLPMFVYAAILLGCIGTVVFICTRPAGEIPQPALPESPYVEAKAEAKKDFLAKHKFFDQSVQPKIAAAGAANQEAVARCLKRIDELFDKYATGVEPFTEDIMSFGSRWQTVKNMSWDWWNEENSSTEFVGGKIEEHLFSEEGLTEDLNKIMKAFREDVQANQTKLLSEIRASISSSSVPEIVLLDYTQFANRVNSSLKKSVSKKADSAIQKEIAVLIGSEVGLLVAEQLIAQLLTKVGTTATTTAATGGTAMVGGTTAGAGTGTFGGPVGTAIGVGVGLVAGIVIDYFMSKYFKAELTTQMTDYLKTLRKGLVEGDNKTNGLAHDLDEVSGSLTESYRTTLFDSIVQSGGGQ